MANSRDYDVEKTLDQLLWAGDNKFTVESDASGNWAAHVNGELVGWKYATAEEVEDYVIDEWVAFEYGTYEGRTYHRPQYRLEE